MACLQIFRSGLSLALHLHSGVTLCRRPATATISVRCRLQERAGDSNGEEPPESLFLKELKRRGITPTSLLEDTGMISYGRGEEEVSAKDENSGDGAAKGRTKRNGVAAAEDYQKGILGQKERSMTLNSEAIEGLIPWSKLLLSIGGTFFLGFWPLMLVTLTAFAALYFFLGSSFVHDATKAPVSLPPYIDPYEVLDHERLSQIVPNVK